ncbi:DUF1493 family protein [Faecalibacter macacae]|uniref:DUF1493 family protein n=1 Tax=Faecalibacter macacae TaxID=1859289 RepID=A0A3L9M0W4_9FLAO|nr:DUF1493 family protein [Faecalibacter macacae]RLZ06401.1 DUF1493 family protein [Faecalibacter macacae]
MHKIEDIILFIKKETSSSIEVHPDTDLEKDIRITGDDISDFLNKYSLEFNVNMKNYLWYFHQHEEIYGGIGALLFKTPNDRVKHIGITPKILLESANEGYWNVNYPEHNLPKFRYDVITNFIIAILIIIFFVFIMYKKYSM